MKTINVVASSRPVQLVEAGEGLTLLFNTSSNGVWLGDNIGMNINNTDSVALLPGLGSIVVDGRNDVYGFPQVPGSTVPISVFSGSLNFFQQLEIITKTLIINAAAGNGLFVYNNLGQLIASITAINGTDPIDSDPTVAVFSTYDPSTGRKLTINPSGILLNDPNNTVGAEIAELPGANPSGVAALNFQAPTNNPAFNTVIFALIGESFDGTNPTRGLFAGFVAGGSNCVNGTLLVVGQINAALPGNPGGSTVGETWHAASLSAGFVAAGSPATGPQYQLLAIGSGQRVAFKGQVNLTANQVAGAVVFTLPVGYRPAFNYSFTVNNNLSGYAATNTAIHVNSSGTVTLGVNGTSGNFISLDGIEFSLD